MSFLNLKEDVDIKEFIEESLRKKGWGFDESDDWEVHGPHQGMNYQVYIGIAYQKADLNAKCICPNEKARKVDCRAHDNSFYVAVYPKQVYKIENASDWGRRGGPTPIL